jgi:hypothetical protein
VFNYCPQRAAFTMQRCLLKLAIIDVRAARCKKQKDSYAPPAGRLRFSLNAGNVVRQR